MTEDLSSKHLLCRIWPDDAVRLAHPGFSTVRFSFLAAAALRGHSCAHALFLGALQFSNRLRSHYPGWHRVIGYIYVASVAISAPVAIVASLGLPLPTLTMASIIQTLGWVTTTATAMYSIRTHRMQQHKEWMMRSYPFAMVFIVNRVITFFLEIMLSGEFALVASCGACWQRRVSCRRS